MTAQNQTQKKAKAFYTAPKLIRYGDVHSLTQAGLSGVAEEKSSSGQKKASDRRAKQNIVRIGSSPLGVRLYLFEYKPEYRDAWGYGRQFGVMADEVETVMPEAVSMHPDGYKMVDYGTLGIRLTLH